MDQAKRVPGHRVFNLSPLIPTDRDNARLASFSQANQQACFKSSCLQTNRGMKTLLEVKELRWLRGLPSSFRIVIVDHINLLLTKVVTKTYAKPFLLAVRGNMERKISLYPLVSHEVWLLLMLKSFASRIWFSFVKLKYMPHSRRDKVRDQVHLTWPFWSLFESSSCDASNHGFSRRSSLRTSEGV